MGVTEQMEFGSPGGNKPKQPLSEDLVRMIYYLDHIGDWATSDVILRWLDWPLTEASRRKLRSLAEASGGRIASGPGAPGYKLTRLMCPQELGMVLGLKTQGARMLKRYIEITRYWHDTKGRTEEGKLR